MAHMRRSAFAAALLVLAACSGSSTATPTAATSSTRTAAPTVTPAPPAAATCTSPIPAGHRLALVSLGKSTQVVVRDITNITRPVTRCKFDGGAFNRFVDATHVSYISTDTTGQRSALYVMDLQTARVKLIRAWNNVGSLFWVYAFSPDGNTLTYLSSTADAKVSWHVLSPSGDVKLSDLGSIPPRDGNPNNDDAMVGFSADGKYVAVEQTLSNTATAPAIVRLSDHKLVYSRTDGSMATWARSGATLYYRTSAGVLSWDATLGSRDVVPQGFKWIHPWPSADGTRIAYEDVDSKGYHHPGYVQISDGQAIRVSSRPRNDAVFLSSQFMWYAEEATCSDANAVCGFGEPRLTGKTFIYDVLARTESPSIITAFFDSWPHSA